MVFNSSLSGALSVSIPERTQLPSSQRLAVPQLCLVARCSTVQFSAAADLVSFDGTFGAGSIMGGSGNDTLVFNAGASMATGTVVKLDAGEDSLTFNGLAISGQFGGGADADSFAGTVTIGGSDVSFWGGTGNDTFNFSTITNVGDTGTAYFWNEGGTDSIVLGSFVSGASNYQSMGFGSSGNYGAGVAFGITSGASMNISFAGVQTTNSFGVSISNVFDVHNNLVSFGIDNNNYVTLSFVGGGEVQLQGFDATEAGLITNTFQLVGAGTANFGTARDIPTFS